MVDTLAQRRQSLASIRAEKQAATTAQLAADQRRKRGEITLKEYEPFIERVRQLREQEKRLLRQIKSSERVEAAEQARKSKKQDIALEKERIARGGITTLEKKAITKQREQLTKIQSELSRTGTILTRQQREAIAQGRSTSISITETRPDQGLVTVGEKSIVTSPGFSALAKKRFNEEKEQEIYLTEYNGKQVVISKKLAELIDKRREEAERLNQATGTVSEFKVETPSDYLLGEKIALKLQQKQNTSGGFRSAGLGFLEGGAGALTVAEGGLRFITSPLYRDEKTLRVVEGVSEGAERLIGSFIKKPRQTLFNISEPAAQFTKKVQTTGLGERELGLVAFDITTLGAPKVALTSSQRISAQLAKFRKDFTPVTEFKAKTVRATKEGVTTTVVNEKYLPNVGSELKNIRIRGGVASTAESLQKQLSREGTTTDAVTAQQNLIPIIGEDGRIRLREVETMDDLFFADPENRLRTSRLGLDVGLGTDDLSSEVVFRPFGSRPQIVYLEDTKIVGFPEEIKRIVARDPDLRSLTPAERKLIEEFQLRKRKDFSAPGFISPESEIVTTADFLDVERIGTTTIGRRRVPIYGGKTGLDDPISVPESISVPEVSSSGQVSRRKRVVASLPIAVSGSALTSSFVSRVIPFRKSLSSGVSRITSGSSFFPSSVYRVPFSSSPVPSSTSPAISLYTTPSRSTIVSPTSSASIISSPIPSIQRVPGLVSDPIPPPPRKRPPRDLDLGFRRPKRQSLIYSKSVRGKKAYSPSLAGIELGIRASTKKPTGFKGLEIRGI